MDSTPYTAVYILQRCLRSRHSSHDCRVLSGLQEQALTSYCIVKFMKRISAQVQGDAWMLITLKVCTYIYIAIYCNVHTTTYNEISSRFCCARQPRRCVQKNDNTQRKHKNQLLQPHKGKGDALLSQHWNISKIRRQTTHSQARTHESRLANRDQPPIKKLCSATGQLL